MLTFLAGTGAGIILALLLGHLERRRVSRRQRELARLQRAMTHRAWDVQDAVALGCSYNNCQQLRGDRDRAAEAYFNALRGE